MKLLIVLSVIACSYAAKLDRTYLPPASASSAGGSPDTLNTPFGSNGQPGQSSRPSGFGPSDGSAFGQAFGSTIGKTSGPTNYGQDGPSSIGQQSGFGKSLGIPQYAQNSGSANTPGSDFYSQSARGFNQPAQGFSQQGNQGISGPDAYAAQRYQPERARASLDRNAEILRYDNQNDGDTFAYSFETSNGISAEESGVATNGVQAQGGYSYTADDGQVISVVYTADENGYQPRGDHLPTPPPIPDEILKSIDENARAAASGYQEGAYRPEENESGFAPEQYAKGVASSYDQNQGSSGPTGISTYNQPRGQGQQQYGVPNAGAAPSAGRTSTRPQGFNQPQKQYRPQSQTQGLSRQYGAPTAGVVPSAGRTLTGFQSVNQPQTQNQPQRQAQGPAQQYGTPTAGVTPSAGRPVTGLQNFKQPQNQYQPQSLAQTSAQQYSASNAGPSSASQPSSSSQGFYQPQNQYQPLPQGPAQQYGTPADSAATGSGTSGSQGFNQPRPNKYYPDFIIPANSEQGLSSPSGIKGFARSQNQDASGYQYDRPNGFPQLGRVSTQVRPSLAPGQSRPETRPGQQPGESNSRTPTQGSFSRPSGTSDQGFSSASGSNGQAPFGKTAPSTQGQFQLNQPSGPKSSMPEESGYTYKGPGSQISGDARLQQSGSQQTGLRPNAFDQGKPGQAFGGPRQPPSFSSEEGYKY